jgi:hypothetical protein
MVVLHWASFEDLVTLRLTLFGPLTGKMATAFICQSIEMPS